MYRQTKTGKIVLLLIVIWSLLPIHTFAEPNETSTEMSENISEWLEPDIVQQTEDGNIENLFLSQTDIVIQGVTHRQDYYFEIPTTRRISEGSFIDLRFGHSSALIEDRSTITLMLNDIPLGSQFLDRHNVEQASWQTDLHEFELEPGFHKLSIVLHMEATDNLCMDQNNPANWFVLHKESVIHLRYAQQYDRGDLSWYPAPYVEKGSLEPFRTVFIVPDAPTSNEWIGLGMLSRFLSGIAADVDVQVLRESDIPASTDLLQSRHLIWLGARSSWNEPTNETIGRIVRANGAATVDKGIVYTEISSWNDEYEMMFVLGNDTTILDAVTMLTEPSLYRQMKGNAAQASPFVRNGTETADSGMSGNETSLADLGYGNLVIEGLMVGSARITYRIPAELDLSQGGILRIHFSHSNSIDLAQSQMMVRINDIPSASTYLSEESSRFGTLEAEIPSPALSGEFIVADISFQFTSSGEACSGSAQIGNWAVVHNDSHFRFSSMPNRDLKLKSLPFPFASNNNWNKTTMLVPAQPTREQLSLFATIHSLFGTSLHSYKQLDVITLPDMLEGDEPWTENNLIVIGTGPQLPAWLTDTDSIPITYRESRWQAVNDHIHLTDSLQSESGLMQLFPSPLHEEADILLMAGSTSSDFERLRNTMVKPDDSSAWIGQVIVVDELERSHPFVTEQYEPLQPMWQAAADYLLADNMPVLQRLLLIAAIMVVLSLFALLVWLFAKRRSRKE